VWLIFSHQSWSAARLDGLVHSGKLMRGSHNSEGDMALPWYRARMVDSMIAFCSTYDARLGTTREPPGINSHLLAYVGLVVDKVLRPNNSK
jgi:hypothetical protein